MTPKTKEAVKKRIHSLHTYLKKTIVDEPQATWVLNRMARAIEKEAARAGVPIIREPQKKITPEQIRKYDGFKEIDNTPPVKEKGDFVYVDNGNVKDGL